MDNHKEHLAPQGVKLTAVTMGHGTNKRQVFVMLLHDRNGKAILPRYLLDRILVDHRRGTTVTIG